MDVWPVSLQQRLNVASFEYRLGKTTLRTDMDAGPAKVRSRFTDAVDVYTCSVLLDYDEIATFKTFYKTTLNNGTEQFLFDDPLTATETAFRFADDPVIRPLGGRTFQLNMIWERMPQDE